MAKLNTQLDTLVPLCAAVMWSYRLTVVLWALPSLSPPQGKQTSSVLALPALPHLISCQTQCIITSGGSYIWVCY